MRFERYIKPHGEIFSCPFCQSPLTINNDPFFKAQQIIAYDCLKCAIPGARGLNFKPYSRYSIGIIENLKLFNDLDKTYDIIANEAFALHKEDNKWYHVYNSIKKNQTSISIVVPASKEFFYPDEEIFGIIHIADPIYFKLIETWNLSDQEATLSKIKTYLTFS